MVLYLTNGIGNRAFCRSPTALQGGSEDQGMFYKAHTGQKNLKDCG